jgi:hypothetical protein
MAATMAKYGKNFLVVVGLLGARLNAAVLCVIEPKTAISNARRNCREWRNGSSLARVRPGLPNQAMRRALPLTVILSALVVGRATFAGDWLTYHNDRYGTTIDYPGAFKPQPPPDADDGRAFKSADGANFMVSASYNALDFNVAKYRDFIMKNLDPGARVTYETRGDNWFVISGTKGADIFYERHCRTPRK